VDFSQCAECKRTTRMICKSCNLLTQEQFHSECLSEILQLKDSKMTMVENLYNVVIV